MPINKCIRVAESEQPAKIDYLRKSNFLSEFSTALDKAKVRQILGIPESASFFWQDLQGLPQKNPELVNYITNKLLPINNRINDLQTTINGLSESYQEIIGLLSGVESIGELVNEVESIKNELIQYRTLALNNASEILNIKLNGTSGGSSGVTESWVNDKILTATNNLYTVINSKANSSELSGKANQSDVAALSISVSSLESTVSSLNNLINGKVDISLYNSDLASVLTRLLNLENGGKILSSLDTDVSSLNASVGDGDKTVTIYAVYSDSSRSPITNLVACNSDAESVAIWENNKVKIIGEGIANLVFSYGGKTITVSVRVGAVGTSVTYYIGYATSVNKNEGHLVGNPDFAVETSSNTITVTGEGLFKYNGCDLGNGQLALGTKLWFCCPANKTLTEWHEDTEGLNVEHTITFNTASNFTLGNEQYKLYYIGILTYDRCIYKFIIN